MPSLSQLAVSFALGSVAIGITWLLVQGNDSWRSPTPSASLPSVEQPANSHAPTTERLATQWFVTPAQAIALIADGATLLDARSNRQHTRGMIDGSVAVSWQQFSQEDAPNRGKLLDDPTQLAEELQNVGVSNNVPIVVVGDPIRGWGEDGRIVWMLRTLGHQRAVLVDGGYDALVAAGTPTVESVSRSATTPGNFAIDRTPQWTIQRDDLKAALDNPQWVIVDVREDREFAGHTPYGEQRGGHVPGAVHLYYKDLMDEHGTILPRRELLRVLAQHGIRPDAQIAAYCTGGIRSGWVTAVLTSVGLDAKNYAGSMWEWAASPRDDYPLVEDD
ncbi:MAG: sulfurtransferase [Elainellaceae cyanobacterium]